MTETTQTTKQKRAPRKPDAMTRILNDIRAQAKILGEYATNPVPEHRLAHHDGRAAAWGRQYAHEGTIDAMVLSYSFEAMSTRNPAEERYALVQLAAVVMARIEQIDEAGQ
ncbi:hypothetical protein SEA_ANDRIS_40 [Streptomyces phage Andris]|nr:hypothetical protein SEA_ANDRIS_40 [Streptomyces phage Andris]